MKQRARLKDIADRTGFSTNTVSLALKHSPLVAEGTGKTIWEAARQLNYRPNQLARSLVSRQSKTIGLILTNIQNPILTRAAQAIQSILAQHGYATLFATSNNSIDEEKKAIDIFFSRQVDGMLIYPTNHTELAHIEEITHNDTPVVLLAGDAVAGVETVSFDARAGARKAVTHLIGLGHRRIGLLDDAVAHGKAEKTDGYRQAFAEAGLALAVELMLDPGGPHAGDGYAAVSALMARADPPTAILTATDMLAIGVLHWCRDHGVRVPQDFSVIGFDNIELSAHATPPLTTVNYAAEDLSRRAVDRLLHLITDDTAAGSPLAEFLEPELVVRGSTGPAPQR